MVFFLFTVGDSYMFFRLHVRYLRLRCYLWEFDVTFIARYIFLQQWLKQKNVLNNANPFSNPQSNDIAFLMLAADYADRFLVTYTCQAGFYQRRVMRQLDMAML